MTSIILVPLIAYGIVHRAAPLKRRAYLKQHCCVPDADIAKGPIQSFNEGWRGLQACLQTP